MARFHLELPDLGLIHGAAISLENGAWGRLLAKLPDVVQTLYAFAVVLFSWVFFRAETFQDAGQYLRSLVNFSMPTAALPVSQFTPVEAVSWLPIALGFFSPRQRRDGFLTRSERRFLHR